MFLKHYLHFKSCKSQKKQQKLLNKLYPTSRIATNVLCNNETVLEGENLIYSKVNIESSKIGFATYICSNSSLPNTRIGRFCSIASNVHIQQATHPTSFISTYPGFFNTINDIPFGKGDAFFDEIIKCKDGYNVDIGNDVWIGEGVTLKGGIKIGDGAVVGMNATVTKDVPPYAIVGGVPAKIIRYRFNDEQIEKLLIIKWWDWPTKLVKERREEFIDVSSFINKYGD